MRTFRYWYIENTDDHNCYSIMAKTKKEALAQLEEHEREYFSDVVELKEIHYKDQFDLVDRITGEDGGKDHGITIKTYKIK